MLCAGSGRLNLLLSNNLIIKTAHSHEKFNILPDIIIYFHMKFRVEILLCIGLDGN